MRDRLRVKQLVLVISPSLQGRHAQAGNGDTEVLARKTYGDFTLGDDYCSVLSADSNSGDTGTRDCLESILFSSAMLYL